MFSFCSSLVGLIFSETLYSMILVYIIHDKGKLLTIVDPSSRHFESKILPLNSKIPLPLFHENSSTCQHVEQMPFFQNTEILRRDVKVLDRILTILNLQDQRLLPRMPGQPGCLYTVGIYRKTPLIHSMQIAKSGRYNGK